MNEKLIAGIVLVALLGYIICSYYVLEFAFFYEGKEDEIFSPKLNYLTSMLTGLVGGIVATAFGIEKPIDPAKRQPKLGVAIKNMAAMTGVGSDSTFRDKVGYAYIISYILIGILSIIAWVSLGDLDLQMISNMSMTFVGMVVAIVTAFFK